MLNRPLANVFRLRFIAASSQLLRDEYNSCNGFRERLFANRRTPLRRNASSQRVELVQRLQGTQNSQGFFAGTPLRESQNSQGFFAGTPLRESQNASSQERLFAASRTRATSSGYAELTSNIVNCIVKAVMFYLLPRKTSGNLCRFCAIPSILDEGASQLRFIAASSQLHFIAVTLHLTLPGRLLCSEYNSRSVFKVRLFAASLHTPLRNLALNTRTLKAVPVFPASGPNGHPGLCVAICLQTQQVAPVLGLTGICLEF
ncbi:hypothetical protein F5877DRAFT_72858 [Lentinula edodes]|nr:hypothetical protein F5877DRAFT_72858 [Lentinula edodes]